MQQYGIQYIYLCFRACMGKDLKMVEIYFKLFFAAYCTLGFLPFHGVWCTPEISRHFLLAQEHLCLIHTFVSQLEFDKNSVLKSNSLKNGNTITTTTTSLSHYNLATHTCMTLGNMLGSACEIVIDYSA